MSRERRVNLVREMESLGIKSYAARALFATGKVTLDGRVMAWEERGVSVSHCYGRMLDAGGRQKRLLGSALAPPDNQQLQL